MTEEIKKILFEELPKTHFGKALAIYFSEEVGELKDVTKVQNWEDTLGRKKALEILKKTLKFLHIEELEKGERTKYN